MHRDMIAEDVRQENPMLPLRSRSLVEQVVDIIGRSIVSGRLREGERVPNETKWAEQLGVSRTALREAISVLTSKGLLDTKQRTGGRVLPREQWQRLDPLILKWEVANGPSEEFISESFELRRAIEPAACALAAERAKSEQLDEMYAAYVNMGITADKTHEFVLHDSTFHQIIFDASGNSMMRAIGALISAGLELNLSLSLDLPRGQSHCLPLHLAVYEAIKARDPEAARIAMLSLLEDAEKDVRDAMRSNSQ